MRKREYGAGGFQTEMGRSARIFRTDESGERGKAGSHQGRDRFLKEGADTQAGTRIHKEKPVI